MLNFICKNIILHKNKYAIAKSKECRRFLTLNLPIEPCETDYIESVALDVDSNIRIKVLYQKICIKSRFKETQKILDFESSYIEPVKVGI